MEKVEIVRSVEKRIKNGDYKGALGEITRCLELYPNFIVAKVLKAECLLKLGNFEEAIALANEVLFSAPDNIKARKLAVEANLELGNIEEAKSHVDFLSFLLPVNHPYLEEINGRIKEKESFQSVSSSGHSDEIERGEVSENNEVSKAEKVSPVEREENHQITPGEEIDVESDKADMVKDTPEEKANIEEKSFHSEDTIIEESESGDFVIGEGDISSVEEADAVEGENEREDKVETVGEEQIITGVLQEQVSTVSLPDKREEPEIKTRTLALIYERQGMLEEALEILENLYNENEDYELLNDIERIKAKLKGGEKSDYVMKKIKKLENWLERIKWHSSA